MQKHLWPVEITLRSVAGGNVLAMNGYNLFSLAVLVILTALSIFGR